MYKYIKGIITENTPTYVAIEASGIGYMVNISLNTFEALQNCQGEVKLPVSYTHLTLPTKLEV